MDYKENIVYRYVDLNGEIIYVGKTENLKKRFNQHKSEDMYKECYKVEYIELENVADIEIYETYYINKYHPKYNLSKVYDSKPSFFIPEQEWKVYYINRGNDTRHSTEIKRYEEIFKDINAIKFNGELPLPRILLTKISKDGRFVYDEVIKRNNSFQFTIELNEEDCFGNTKFAVYSLFHNMVHMYNFLHNIKDCSRGETYHNSRFRNTAVSHGGFVGKDSKNGYRISGVDKEIKESIYKYNIDYNAGEKYKICKEKNKSIKNNSIKYMDENGHIARTTKEHILFCLDDSPELVKIFVEEYGISPMKIC